MIYVSLPSDEIRQLSFYLALEEYVARQLAPADYFFMWQVKPSVIFGRNQLIENEVNMDYCRSHNIQMFRRKSGGGCVYADMNNVMMSYIRSGGIYFQSLYQYGSSDVTETGYSCFWVATKRRDDWQQEGFWHGIL